MVTNSESRPSSSVCQQVEQEVQGDVDEDASFQGDPEEVDVEGEVENGIGIIMSMSVAAEPNNLSLLLRHRTPKNNSDIAAAAVVRASRHRRELERIHLDSASYTRHALDLNDDDRESDEPWKWCWKQQQQQRDQRESSIAATTETNKCFMKQTLQNQGLLPCQQLLGVAVNWQTLRKDVIAGMSVAIVAIPLSMSYAKLAGLPAYYGLYANLPAGIYPLFGSSLQLAVGPAALVSLLLSTGLSTIVAKELPTVEFTSDEYLERYAQLAIQSSLLVGIVKTGMGLLKLGFLTQIMSKALISGFTSGAAVMIAMSQVKHLLGVSNVPAASRFHDAIKNLAEQSDNFSWKTFLLGSLCILVLVSLKYAKEKNPQRQVFKWLFVAGPLMVSGISILLTYVFDLEDKGIFLVGDIPAGLPKITVDQWMPLSSDLWVRRCSCCLSVCPDCLLV